MKVTFSTLFRSDLLEAESRYSAISTRLGEDFHNRVKEVVRTIIQWQGGDHVGPHGFPCRKCHPFPYVVCYEIEDDTLYVHEQRHPDYLRKNLPPEKSN